MAEAPRVPVGPGLNRLVRAATPLLLLAGRLRGSLAPLDVEGLRRHALEEIRRFESQARTDGVSNEIVVAARYVLCASLDEAVLSTPWGAQSEWSQHPLLVTLHRETWGGEKFFQMLERVSADPDRHLELMELQYLALAFGFSGRYAALDRGHERLAGIQHDLFRTLRERRGTPHDDLSLRWRGLQDRRNPLVRYVPWWVIGAASLAVVALVFTWYYRSLAQQAEPVQAALAKIGRESLPAPEPPPAPGPTLKQLLRPEEASGTMRVEEQGARTRVTLLAPDLFESGSAVLSAGKEQTLDRLADAIDKVPGRVEVVGHTDDQPVRSLRFASNYELSRERARGVAEVLQRRVANPARIRAYGVGDSEPAFRPPDLPANRARNRRVEIIHVRGF